MVDPVLLAKAVMIGGLVAGVVLACTARFKTLGASWSWAIAAGVLAASGATDQWPHWPPLEDRARFLTLLIPLTLLVETWGASPRGTRSGWMMRTALAAITAPILLHGSVYVSDHSGPGSAEWPASQALGIFSVLAALLLLVWASLCKLQARTSTRSVVGLLAVDALAAAVTVMLSGYYRVGMLGLGLCGALVGTWLAARWGQASASDDGSLGMGVVGVFAVVVLGRFFGTLSNPLAACLLLMPLMGWLPELPRLRQLQPHWRHALRWACVVIPLLAVVIVAQRKFIAASTARPRSQPSAVASDPDGK